MASIATRARRLNLITDYQSKKFWMEMSRLGYRKREPNEPPREQPKLLRQMIEFHRRTLDYSDDDISNLLCTTPEEFRTLYNFDPKPRPHLRLVN